VYELALFPVTFLVVKLWKRIEGIDVFDEGISYAPF
jgi:hypothetical protein